MLTDDASAALGTGVLACNTGEPERARTGAYDRVIALFDAHWKLAEASLPAHVLGRLRIIEAFARFHRGDEDGVRAASIAAEAPAASELAALTGRWPELAAFVDRAQSYRAPAR